MDSHKIQIIGLLAPSPQKPPIPMFSEVSCGFPSPAEEFSEELASLDDIAISAPAATFLVRAGGDSMVGAGIYPRDIIVVDRSKTAKNRDIVLAVVHGEFTCKRFLRSRGQIILRAENPSYADIVISEEHGFFVWGVCTFNLHRLSTC